MRKLLLVVAILIASPLMGQGMTQNPDYMKSIVSVNYSLGISGGFSFTESDSKYYTKFQTGASLEYIIGKKWHAIFGLNGIFLDDPAGAFTVGFGITFVDNRNAEGIGFMFDWNILSAGLAFSESNLGFSYTTSFRFRYMLKPKVGIQAGLDIQSYYLTLPAFGKEITSSSASTSSASMEMYYGFNIGVSFGE